jgi:hypothetical protein
MDMTFFGLAVKDFSVISRRPFHSSIYLFLDTLYEAGMGPPAMLRFLESEKKEEKKGEKYKFPIFNNRKYRNQERKVPRQLLLTEHPHHGYRRMNHRTTRGIRMRRTDDDRVPWHR